MADMTSTLTISGTVNGKKIAFTHVYTMADVYDAGTHDRETIEPSPEVYSGDAAGGPAITFVQDTPTYLLAVNKDTYGVSKVVTDINLGVFLGPTALFCTTGTLGIAKITASATDITLDDLGGITIDPVAPFPCGRIELFTAFNAVS